MDAASGPPRVFVDAAVDARRRLRHFGGKRWRSQDVLAPRVHVGGHARAAAAALIFGVTRIVNFAHGSFYMLAAYLTYSLWAALPLGPASLYTRAILAAAASAYSAPSSRSCCC